MFWRKSETTYAPIEEVIYWPCVDGTKEASRIQVTAPFLALHNRYALFTHDVKDLTTNCILNVESGDFNGFLLIDANGFSAHVERADDLGPVGPAGKRLGIGRSTRAVRLVFENSHRILGASEVKAHLLQSFEVWEGWRKMLGQPAFENLKHHIDKSGTVEEIFRVLVHFNRRD